MLGVRRWLLEQPIRPFSALNSPYHFSYSGRRASSLAEVFFVWGEDKAFPPKKLSAFKPTKQRNEPIVVLGQSHPARTGKARLVISLKRLYVQKQPLYDILVVWPWCTMYRCRFRSERAPKRLRHVAHSKGRRPTCTREWCRFSCDRALNEAEQSEHEYDFRSAPAFSSGGGGVAPFFFGGDARPADDASSSSKALHCPPPPSDEVAEDGQPAEVEVASEDDEGVLGEGRRVSLAKAALGRAGGGAAPGRVEDVCRARKWLNILSRTTASVAWWADVDMVSWWIVDLRVR